MICATEQLELVVQLPAGRAESKDVLAQLSGEDLKVHACGSYCGSDGQVLLLMVEEPIRALAVLREAGHDCRSQPVLVIELPRYDVGLMVRVTKELEQAGVFILRSHVTLLDQGGLKVALQTSDNKLALRILQNASSRGRGLQRNEADAGRDQAHAGAVNPRKQSMRSEAGLVW